MHLGLHIATGASVGDLNVEQGPVILIEEDQSDEITLDYLTNLKAGVGIAEDEPVPFCITSPKSSGFKVQTKEDRVASWRKIESMHPVLVIFGSCERICPAREHTSAEFQEFIRLFRLCAGDQIASIIVDHTNKSNDAKGNAGGCRCW